MPYNLTIIGNQTGILPMIQTTNEVLMFGHFGNLFLITLGVILFMSFMARSDNPKGAIAATSIIVFIVSVGMRALSLVGDLTIYITLISAAISAAFLFVDRR